jgi:hypothetical protein
MDENPEPSWTTAIRAAVKEFIEAVNESSKQLAGASERFAVESLQVMDAARARSEQSASASAEMARKAQQAAEDARNAATGLQSAVEEARESVRNEARLTIEQVASQTAQIHEIGAQVKYDLQQRVEEMLARLEAGAAGHKDAVEVAQAATAAARDAAERIESSVNAIEAAVRAARQSADEARNAAEQSEKSVGTASMAVESAQEAAESSRQAASLAEQAGKRSDFAAEASFLLERLETDYSLLTRLVQELHSRISSLSSVSVAPPQPSYQPSTSEEPPYEEPSYDEAPYDASYEASAYEETVAEATAPESVTTSEQATEAELAAEVELARYADMAAEAEAPAAPEAAPAPQPPVWEEQEFENFEPQPLADAELEPADSLSPSSWPVQPPADLQAPAPTPVSQQQTWPQATQPAEPAATTPEPARDVAPEVSIPAGPSITIAGRVQITISPVPDFDRLLSLDSALARIKGVHSVTLADYAREEVIFRVELDQPMSVVEFAHHLSDTGGIATEVTEASESTLSIRIG